MYRREATSIYSDSRLLASEIRHWLLLKALSKGKPNPGPLDQNSLLLSILRYFAAILENQ